MRKARENHKHNIRAIAARISTTLLGTLLLIYGVFAFLTPLPLGFPLIIIGIFMIAAANPAFRSVIVRARRRWKWFDKLVMTIAPRASESVRAVIEETQPREDPDCVNDTEEPPSL